MTAYRILPSERGVPPYQRFIGQTLERAVAEARP